MIIKVFLAPPLFTKNKQTLVKDICMEFISCAPGLCPDQGNNPVNLINKVPAMLRVNTASGRYEQHTFYSDAVRKKYPVLSYLTNNLRFGDKAIVHAGARTPRTPKRQRGETGSAEKVSTFPGEYFQQSFARGEEHGFFPDYGTADP